ncbi:MAG TPA: cytochrome c oxidase subunit 4 [Actinomycetota bacterium]|nr:cytochrome c oxidase subunit 4 [Actinomycetota bacterium]
MRTATWMMLALFAYGAISGTIYWFVTYEPAGTLLLWSFSLMPVIVAAYLVLQGAARERTLEDDPDATPDRAAGQDLGPFPAASTWPVVLVLGSITVGASLVYGLLLLPVGLGVTALAVLGLMRESRG